MLLLPMLDKEIIKLRRTKLKLSQLSQIAMDQTAQRVLTASLESHSHSAQETLNQRNRKVLKLTAELYQLVPLKEILSHQNATKLEK